MKIVKNNFKSNIKLRTQKNFPVEGIEFIDITTIFLKRENFKEMIDIFTNQLKDKNIDYIVAPEARGFLIASAVADRLDVGIIPVRKKGKLPDVAIETTFEYEKEYGKDTFCLTKLVDDSYKDKNIVILDDIYATGNTVKSIKKELKNLGANVLDVCVIMNIIELNNDEVFSIIDVNEE